MLLLLDSLLEEVWELPRLLDCWGEDGYEDGGDEADEEERGEW